jgi:ABC-type transport system substrate-binding protein
MNMTARKSTIVIIAVALIVLAVGVMFLVRSPKPLPSSNLHDILILQNNQISSFDPLGAYHAGHIQIVKQLYDTLVDVDLEGKPVPSVARKWTTKDGQTWRILLRDDVLFHPDACFTDESERRVTAQDVAFTFHRMLAHESKSLGISYFMDIVGAAEYHAGTHDSIDGLRVVDNHTIEIALVSPDFGFPSRLTLPYVSIVPQEAIVKYGKTFAQHPVGTGPFRLERYEANTLISLVRNPDYWEEGQGGPLPAVERVYVHLVADENRALLMFRNREADFLELSRPMYEQYRQGSMPFKATLATQANAQINMYLCNLETLNRPSIRQGLSLALDRSGLKEVLSQEGTVAGSLFPPSIFPLLAKPGQMLRHDMEEARKKLSGIETLRLVCFEDAMSRAMADRYARSLSEVGVKVKIEAVPFPVLVERLTSGQYDLIQLYWGPIYSDPAHYLTPFLAKSFPPNGNNFNRYSNPEVDQLVTKSQTLKDDARDQALLRAQELILQDMPFVLLYFKATVRASNQRFEMPLHPLQYRLYKLARPQ